MQKNTPILKMGIGAQREYDFSALPFSLTGLN